jgi:hypothetical protein
MAMTLQLVSALGLLTALGSACSPSFEAELTEVEVTQRGVKIAAVPCSAPAGDVSVTAAFTLSSADAAWAKRVNADVLIHQVRVAPGTSQPNLDFVKFARSTVAAAARPETTTEIMNYDRGESMPAGPAIEVAMPVPVDITIPWNADKTVIEIQLAGQLPAQDWTIDVTLKLSGKIMYTY